MHQPGTHTSIFFPSREAFILRHPISEAESGINFCISVGSKPPAIQLSAKATTYFQKIQLSAKATTYFQKEL
jgi:hypothetical protein